MKKIYIFFILIIFLSANAYSEPFSLPSGSKTWGGANGWKSDINKIFNYFDSTGGELPASPTIIGPLEVTGTGDSWIELDNNTTSTDDLTGKYGIRFYNGSLQQIINGTASSVGGGVGGYVTTPTYSDDTCTVGQWSFDASYCYICEATNQWDRYAVTFANWNNPAPTTPVLSSATLGVNGETLTLVFDQAVTQGAGYNDADIDIDASVTGNDIAVTYSSGDTTDTHVYTLGSVVNSGETVDIDFNGDANSLENSNGDDLAAIVSGAVTNNSTQGGAGTTPDALYECEDNAASTTVVATYGSNGTLVDVNTADNTSTTHFSGTRSFSPSATTTRIVSGALTEASLDDGAFTVQFAYYADNTTGFGTGNYVRLVAEANTQDPFRFRSDNGSSTAFLLSLGGTEYSVTLDDINTASWHVIRIVIDASGTNKAVVYQGTTEGNLVAKYTRTSSITTPSFPSTPTITFGGDGDANRGIYLRNGKIDDIKIWYTAEVP